MGALTARSTAIAVVFGLLSSCAAIGNGHEEQADAAALEMRISRTPSRLEIFYVVRNTGPDDLGLFNRFPGLLSDGTVGFLPERASIKLEGSTLHVRKMVLAPPAGARASEQTIPYVTVVGPGGRFEERFSLPIPVTTDDPLVSAAREPAQSSAATRSRAEATNVVLTIGVFRRTPDMKLIAAAPQYPNVFRVWPPTRAVDNQQTLSVRAPLDSAVAVSLP